MPAAKPSLNLHQRLHAAMGVVKYIQKDSTIKLKSGGRFKVITHDAVTAKVRPAVLKQGIVYYPIEIIRTQVGNRTDVDLKVRFVNIDNPGDYIDVPGIASAITNEDKGPGMAVSYAVKYCLLKALGLETGEDADLASGEVATVDPRAGAGIPAPEEISFDLISPVGEVEITYPDAQSYMTELANRVKDDGNYWPSNEHIVDLIAERDTTPLGKKWVRQLRKLGKAAYANAQAAKEAAGTAKTFPITPVPDEPSPAEEDGFPEIPASMDKLAKFQLLSPKGKTEAFIDPKKFLGALETEMLADPVTWWALNGKLAQELAETGDAATKGWVDGLLEMAVESGKEEPNPLAGG